MLVSNGFDVSCNNLVCSFAEKEKLDQELMSLEAHALKGKTSSKHHVLRVVSTANEL